MNLKAQENPVKWLFNAQLTSGNEFILTFEAQLADGWYIYAQDPTEGPVTTTFYFSEDPNIEFLDTRIEEKGDAKIGYDPNFETEVKKYAHAVVFSTHIKVKKNNALLSGYINYMTCDAQRCLPPVDMPFEFKFKNE